LGRGERGGAAWRFLRELGLYAAASVGALLAWAVADWLLRLPPAAVLAGLGIAALAAVGGLIAWLTVALIRREPRHGEALLIERLHGGLDNSLIGTLQLVEQETRQPGVFSADLVAALARGTAALLRTQNLARLMDRRPAARAMAAAGCVVLAAGLLAGLVDGFVAGRIASARDSYRAVVETIWPVKLAVSPGDKTVLRGEEDVHLRVSVIGGACTSARLLAKDQDGAVLADADVALSPSDGGARAGSMRLGAAVLAAVQSSVRYQFTAGRHASRAFTIRVVERPRIENLSADLQFPAYTQMMPQQLSGMFTSIRALRETIVTMSLAANKPLSRGTLSFTGEAEARYLDITGRFASTQFAVKTPADAELQLTCEDGCTMKQPFRFKIEPLDDSPPEVQILMKRGELLLLKDEVKSFGFAYEASDDFGITQVQVLYEIEPVDRTLGREKQSGELKPLAFMPPERKTRGVMKKPFDELAVSPGDRVTFYMTATDNNTKTGPSTGRSQSCSFVVVLPNLAGYNQPEFDWALRRSLLLGSLTKVRRNTDFLKLPEKRVSAEKTVPPPKHKLSAHVPPESWPAGVEQAVTDYLHLLSTHNTGE